MTELLIKNGFVFDPLNKINGEKMDIAIKNGKIVELWQETDLSDLTRQLQGFCKQ